MQKIVAILHPVSAGVHHAAEVQPCTYVIRINLMFQSGQPTSQNDTQTVRRCDRRRLAPSAEPRQRSCDTTRLRIVVSGVLLLSSLKLGKSVDKAVKYCACTWLAGQEDDTTIASAK